MRRLLLLILALSACAEGPPPAAPTAPEPVAGTLARVDLNAPQTCAEAPGPHCYCECPAGYSAYVVGGPTSGNWQKICAKGGDPNEGIPCGAAAPSPSPSAAGPEGDDDYEEPPPAPWVGFRFPPVDHPVSLAVNVPPDDPLNIAVNVREWETPADWCLPITHSFRVRWEVGRFAGGHFAEHEKPVRIQFHTITGGDVHVLEADTWRSWGHGHSLVGDGPYLAGAAHYEIPDQDTGAHAIRNRTRIAVFAGDRCEP